jgi:hypothetical protein
MVERIANELGLKISEYGMYVLSKSPDGSQGAVFQYKLKAVNKIREILDAWGNAPIEDVSLEEEFYLSGLFL